MPDQTVRTKAIHMAAVASGRLKIIMTIATICATVFVLPPLEAASTTPSAAAIIRNPVTMNSLARMTTTIQAEIL